MSSSLPSGKWSSGLRRWVTIQKYSKLEPEKIFLCNWYVKLVKPGREIPPNEVQCHVPMKMTKFDIKNYFQKIYNVKVDKVNVRIQQGKPMKMPNNTTVKKPDYKVAYLILANQTFEFPELFTKYQDLRPKYYIKDADDEKDDS